jgi:hypothetical protein
LLTKTRKTVGRPWNDRSQIVLSVFLWPYFLPAFQKADLF